MAPVTSKTRTASSLVLATVLAFAALDSGCGTWLGNPKDPGKENPPPNSMVTLRIQGTTESGLNLAASSIPVLGMDGNVQGYLTFSSARLALKEIKLKLATDDTEQRQEFTGPYVVDLLTNTVMPETDSIEVPAGAYKDVQLKLAKLEKDKARGVVSEGDPLIERSVYLQGSYKPTTGAAVTVTMDFDLDEEFSLRKSGSAFAGMDIREGETNPMIIVFSMDRWFDFRGRTHDLATLKGEIVLTKDGQEDAKKVREAIKENIKLSAKFGKDSDQDGKLNRDEASESH